jgi:anion transporter
VSPAIITFVILGVAAILFFTELFPLPVTAMLVPISLYLTGCVPFEDVFKNFGNKWVILFLGMFMVGEAIIRTGLADRIGKLTVKAAGTSQTRLLILIMLVTGVMSAFLSNTGTTVVFIPIVLGICASAGIHSGKILMPMAFAASLGGTMTVIGTPPNGVVNSELAKLAEGVSPEQLASIPTPFEFFEFAKIGIVLFIVGVAYYALIGARLLPASDKAVSQVPEPSSDSEAAVDYRTNKIPVAAAIFIGVIILMAAGKYIINPMTKESVPLAVTAMLGACLVIATKCITMEEAFKSVSWTTIFLFAGMLTMSTAMQKTGAASMVAEAVTSNITSPYVLLAVVLALTAVITNFMSNTATTALMAPIGIAIAQSFGVSPLPIVMGVAMSASCCFATPIATPPNTIVLGPGGYHFKDYLKAGWPLQLIAFAVCMLLIPVIWPFHP